MPVLSRELLDANFQFLRDVELPAYPINLPERVIQFGEGNFLRAFVEWMFHSMNNAGLFNGSIVVVQPIAEGMAGQINKQDGLYTLALRGLKDGAPAEELSLVGCVSRALSAVADWNEVLRCAENPEIEFLISNTTEAGISYDPNDRISQDPPASFPGKVTAYLFRRFQHFQGDPVRGITLIPCELIDRNGDILKQTVLRYAKEWDLPSDFSVWVEQHNLFLNSLVDRVVTGYPRDEATAFFDRLGYEDQLLDTGELFHLWVIEGPAQVADKLPFVKAGLNVVWTDDMTPYRTRKVRILNGAHTSSVPAAFLYGLETVGEMMDDPVLGRFAREVIYQEIIPATNLDKAMLTSFADEVVARFQNPYIKHYLLSILLNSTSKFKARVLPSLLDYQRQFAKLPLRLVFSLAALTAVYKDGTISGGAMAARRAKGDFIMKDDLPVLKFFAATWEGYDGTEAAAQKITREILANTGIWGQDLNAVPELTDLTAQWLYQICESGMAAAMTALLEQTAGESR